MKTENAKDLKKLAEHLRNGPADFNYNMVNSALKHSPYCNDLKELPTGATKEQVADNIQLFIEMKGFNYGEL